MADRKKKPGHDDAWWAAQRHAYIEKNDIPLLDAMDSADESVSSWKRSEKRLDGLG